MCDPITLAVTAAVVSTAQAVGGVIAQSKAAKAQTKAIKEQAAVVREENRMKASSELFDQGRAARREQGRIRAAAGEAGLGLNSGSIEGLLLDSAMQQELARDRSVANMESRNRANVMETQSALSQIQKPTLLGAGLQIGSAALDGFSGIRKAQITTKQG